MCILKNDLKNLDQILGKLCVECKVRFKGDFCPTCPKEEKKLKKSRRFGYFRKEEK